MSQLVSLLSIGTLLAYTVVAISIMILRYMDNSDTFNITQPLPDKIGENMEDTHNVNENSSTNHRSFSNCYNVSENSSLISRNPRINFKAVWVQLFNLKRNHIPNALSTRIVGALTTLLCKYIYFSFVGIKIQNL